MKITEILSQEKPVLSFEVFPPKKESADETVEQAAVEIARLSPSFMSVTYGAGGGTSQYTADLAACLAAAGPSGRARSGRFLTVGDFRNPPPPARVKNGLKPQQSWVSELRMGFRKPISETPSSIAPDGDVAGGQFWPDTAPATPFSSNVSWVLADARSMQGKCRSDARLMLPNRSFSPS